ncbi:S-layer homology domain-containing protein [Fusibacter ferrireducens]|uniref:S-layer homology domain-containing protein n=1 Tax=Fusibacter ferrireducens TaxID=2785058 RepID=A0ABR9ZZS8_9FIRM|nr:S-layer homology domain-containing protein [Fusibacter ferrireducens]MBF4695119.1 S-layer homology domain-containing protein [Fusibacter ferrireducens]
MKRKIIILLMITVLTTSALMSFAEESSADLLFKYGFIAGDNGDLMVDQNLTRAQACVLLSEMYGKKKAASSFVYIKNFSDVDSKDWYAPYVTYAKTSGWVSGYPDGTFKPNASVSRQEWSAMLMNALGYTYEWSNVILDMNTLGINFTAANSAALKRGEAFNGMWQALLTPAKNDVLALGLKLNKIPEDVIASLGGNTSTDSTTANSGDFEIKSYKAIGLTELEFTFSKALDNKMNMDLSHVELKQDSNFFLKPLKIVLSQDMMSLNIVTNIPIIQNRALEITFKDIDAKDGSKMTEKKLSNIQFADTTLPQLRSAEIIGDYYIKVTFNEPVQSDEDQYPNIDTDSEPELYSTDFVVNGGQISVYDAKLSNNNKTAIIQCGSKLTEPVKIKAQNTIKDYAGFNLYVTELTAELNKDTVGPKVVSYRVNSPTQVVLVWDEDLKLINGLYAAYYHTNATSSIDQNLTKDQLNGNEMTLNFSKKPLNAGSNNVIVLSGAVSDYAGNKNVTETVTVMLPPDNTKPTVVGEPDIIDDHTVVVYFSEALKNTTGELNLFSNYVFKDQDGNEVRLSSAVYDAKAYTITIRTIDKLMGNYTLAFKNFKDYSDNVLEDSGHKFSVQDMTVPSPAKWFAKVFFTSSSEQDVLLFFDEAMNMSGKYSVLDRNNYSINGIKLSSLPANSVSIKKIDDMTVQFTIARSNYGGINIAVDGNTSADAVDMTINRVADISGNITESNENYVDLREKANITVEEFRYIGNNQCEIVLSDKVDVVDVADFEITKNNGYYAITSHTLSTDEKNRTVITAILSYPIDNIYGFLLKTVGQNTKTSFGETFSSISSYKQMTEYIVSGIKKVFINGQSVDDAYYTKGTGIVTIEFTKPLNGNTISSLTFDIPGVTIDKIVTNYSALQLYINVLDQDKISQYMSIIQKYPLVDNEGLKIENISTRIEYIN